ncbi:MAG: MFS transporter [Armatimonadota bacterium]
MRPSLEGSGPSARQRPREGHRMTRSSVYIRLCAMMFLQYVIWGAWAPVLAAHLQTELGLSGVQTALIFLLLPLAMMVSPFLGGQIADRWLPTQWFLAIVNVLAAVAMFVMAGAPDFATMWPLMLIWALLYAPTLPLTNSLSFHHLKDPDKQFGWIRVWGTIGWIVAGLLLTLWRNEGFLAWLVAHRADSLVMGAAASMLMAVLSVFLPHTPPAREAKNPWAFGEALRLFRRPGFTTFMIISFVVITELQFYYLLTPVFLQTIGVDPANVPATMTIGQIGEIFVMAALLPWLLPKLGVARSLAIGVIAWPIRYVVFALMEPLWLVIASLPLPGFCYVFFFVVGQIYVDRVAPKDIRASAQSLLALITLGGGSVLGFLFAGQTQDWFTAPTTELRWQAAPGTSVVSSTPMWPGPVRVTLADEDLKPNTVEDEEGKSKLAQPSDDDTGTWHYDFGSRRLYVNTGVAPPDAETSVGVVQTNWRYVFLVPVAITVLCAIAFLLWFKDPEAEGEAEAEPEAPEEEAA